MLDYYSNYPAPSREEAIKELKKEFVGEEKIIEEVINGMPSLGSYTGWYMGFKKDAIEEVRKRIKQKK